MTKKNDTPAEDPILTETPTVDIAGRTYTVRKLGVRDTFRVARIMKRGVAALGDRAGNLTAGDAVQVLVASMTENEDEVLAMLASLISVDVSDFDDTDRFPMDSIIDILKALSEHQDLKAFLAKVADLIPSMSATKTA